MIRVTVSCVRAQRDPAEIDAGPHGEWQCQGIGVWQRFRRKWAIWRVGQPPLFKCIFTWRVASIAYGSCVIVQPSLFVIALTRWSSRYPIHNQSIAEIWPNLYRIVAIPLYARPYSYGTRRDPAVSGVTRARTCELFKSPISMIMVVTIDC